ncbi:hypothetical protein AB4Z32_17475 [Massilia sp. 2TAF26]|uniref:hypothetical protein n=1 Tax=Massilia sp. 2TAF26 TaxID=3233012 RepID=UPI003F9A2D0D
MKKGLSVDGHAHQPVTDPAESQLPGDANRIASRVALPSLRYTLPDFNKNWRGRLMQKIIDHLHKGGD